MMFIEDNGIAAELQVVDLFTGEHLLLRSMSCNGRVVMVMVALMLQLLL